MKFRWRMQANAASSPSGWVKTAGFQDKWNEMTNYNSATLGKIKSQWHFDLTLYYFTHKICFQNKPSNFSLSTEDPRPRVEGHAGHLVAQSLCCWSPWEQVYSTLLIGKSSSETALCERLVAEDKCLPDVTGTRWPVYLLLCMFFPLHLVRHLWLPRFSDWNETVT